jgi:large subunit ribosomal protein L9
MKMQLLLLEDVDNLGRSGDVVTAKRGFIRNFLLPRKKAVIASPHTLRKQAALKEEREKRAAVDKKESEALAAKLVGFSLRIEVKVDPEGNMYGSVTAHDLSEKMKEKGFPLEKSNFQLQQPIRAMGPQMIQVKLKEGVKAPFELQIHPEGGEYVPPAKEEAKEEKSA